MLPQKLARLIATASALFLPLSAMAEEGVTDTEIKLGMVNVQTGPASALGKGMRAGAEAYFKEVNAKGGIHGRQIRLSVADDGYEPNKAVDETLKMIEGEKVFALFGHVGTPTANAVIPIVKELDVPLVGLFTGAMSLRQPVTKQIFNVRASYDDEAETLVAHFVAQGAKSVAVFYQDDGFGLAVLSGTEKALKQRGMAVAARGTFERNTVAINTGLAAMLNAKPDAIVMVGPYTPLAAFVKAARAAGLKSQLATVSFVGTDSLVSQVGKDGDGVVISQVVPFPHDDTLAVTAECRALVAKHTGEPFGFVNFEGCLTARVMAAALEKSGKAPTRATLMQTLEAMKGVDLGGMAVSFAPDNHQAFNQVFLTRIVDGKISKLK
ncbi:ABC transporter substrate-binding protein [Pseudoduganella namucuonensis]|uniref:Amino acid/amide ABC transporter substrate-binding protein, HAAT family n=1 Tax=Pseudoduganella namucuonensis TaxID=1035707 RepID=A0A1I7LBU7_9BURK|nr:ABC transporter substrate-binding protein [Pseudoduganella namucuonensis]SFV07211.1 amino acid/amide ABC transporter substrate-binding protein, HAAT family [Pseudoduganella namucuonensis]